MTADELVNTGDLGTSQSGAMTLKARVLRNSGQLGSRQAGRITVTKALTNTGSIVVQSGDLDLSTGSLINGRDINTVNGAMRIVSNGRVENRGTLYATTNLQLEPAGVLDNQGGQIGAGNGLLTILTENLNNRSGKIIATRGALTADVANIINDSGTIQAYGDAIVQARNVQNKSSGLILSQNGRLSLRGRQAGRGLLEAVENASGQIGAFGDVSIESGRYNGDARSQLSAGGALKLVVRGQLNNDGDIFARKDASIRFGRFNNGLNGVIASKWGGLHLTQKAAQQGLNSSDTDAAIINDGTIETITQGQDLRIEGSALSNAGKILSKGNMLARFSHSIENTGTIAALHGGLNLSANDITNVGVLTANEQNVMTAASGLANSGQIAATNGLTINVKQKLQNLQGGEIGSERGVVTLTSRVIENIAAHIVAAKARVTIVANELLNRAGLLQGKEIQLTVDQAVNKERAMVLATDGAVSLRGETNAQAATLLNDDATIQGGGNVNLSLSSLDNRSGTVLAEAGNIVLAQGDAGVLANAKGILQASQDVSISSGSYQGDNDAVVRAGIDIAANFAGGFSNAGVLLAHRNISLNAGSFEQAAGSEKRPAMIASETGFVDLKAGAFRNAGFIQTGDVHSIALPGLELGSGAIRLRTRNFQNSGIVTSGGRLNVSARGKFEQAGKLVARQDDLEILGQIILNSGHIASSGTLTIRANEAVSNRGELSAGAGFSGIAATSFDNATGHVTAAHGDINITAGGGFSNKAGILLASEGSIVARAATFDNDSGTLQAQNGVAIRAASVSNVAGTVLSITRDLSLQDRDGGGADLQNTRGIIQGQNSVLLRVLDPKNDAGQILAMEGPLSIFGSSSSHLSNHSGAIETTQDLILTAGQYDGGGDARLTSGGKASLNFNGHVLNGGQVAAAKDLTLKAASVQNLENAVIASANGAVSIELSGVDGLTNAGTVQSGGWGQNFVIEAQNLSNAATRGILSRGDMSLSIASALGNLGEITAFDSDLTLNAARITNDHLVLAGRLLTPQAGDVLVNTGLLYGRQGAQVHAVNTIQNRGAQMGADDGRFVVTTAQVETSSVVPVRSRSM